MVNILLPTDFSDNSFHAGAYAARLFGTKDVSYTLVHTYLDADPSITPWAGMGPELYKAAAEGMRDWEERLRVSGLFGKEPLATEVIYGPLQSMLNDLGKERKADLVVMGTQGRSGAGLLGSNAAAMVKHSNFPVLVVPNKTEVRSVSRILFADDQKGVEVAGTRMLLHIALSAGAEIILAHVLRHKDDVPDPEIIAMYEELLQAVPHRFMATEGEDVAGAIDYLAEQEGADMIAVLHRHTGFFEGLFKTSTAKRLALHTNVPLLVMQAQDERGRA
ncbi:MAG: universal stress protein [Flavobacteriales bacterium]|jgi:nucleotide-binding universal stress UspA family protein|nr:universal stress protein [Flavobacteriales bacterium]MCB0759462.1 universal stress protein [Flavobacteriales bacterium]